MLEEERELGRLAIASSIPPTPPGLDRRVLAVLRSVDGDAVPNAPAEHRRVHLGRPLVALATILVAAVVASVVAVPPVQQAAAQLPGLGVLGGLYGARNDTSGAPLAEATDSNLTVRVVDAYDDGTTVAVGVEVMPSGRQAPQYEIGWDQTPTMTDSTGHRLDSTFTPIKNALTTTTLTYNRALDGSPAGTPVTIEATGINLLGPQFPNRYRTVRGQWKLRVTPKPSSLTRPLALPLGGQLGQGTVTFTTIRANDAYIFVRVAIGTGVLEGSSIGKPGGLLMEMYGPDGKKLTMLTMRLNDTGDAQTAEWQLADRSGRYRIVLSDGRDTLERPIEVPMARGASVPVAMG